MKVDQFDITLVKTSNQGFSIFNWWRNTSTFQERRVNDVDYFVAIPGEEYKVHIKWNIPQLPTELVVVVMLVDGRPIRMCYHFNNKHEVEFDGFYMSNCVQAFKFDNVRQVPMSNHGNSNEYGFFTFDIWYCRYEEGAIRNPMSDVSNQIPEDDKKFWKKASSCTVLGKLLRTVPSVDWHYSFISRIKTIRIPYHTAETLDLIEQNIKNKKIEVVKETEVNTFKRKVIDLTDEKEPRRSKRLKSKL